MRKKRKDRVNQLTIVYNFLKNNTTSRYMCAMYTGVPLQSICRYVKKLFDYNRIAIVRIDRCEISGEWVEFLTTDPEKFPEDNQLNMFED